MRPLFAVALVGAICFVAKLVLITLLVSGLIAVMLSPVVRALARSHLPRPVGAFLVVAGFVAATYGIGQASYQRVAEFARTLPTHSGDVRHVIASVRKPVHTVQETAKKVVGSTQAPAPPGPLIDWQALARGLGTITEVLVALSFIPVLVYFALSWEPRLIEKTVELSSRHDRGTLRTTLVEMARMLRRFVFGNLVLGLAMSAVLVPILWLLHVPFFVEAAFASGFLSLIPYLGILIAPLVPLLVGVGQLDPARMLISVVAIVASHLVALNVVYPKLIGRSLELNPVASSIALLVWGWLWGPAGLVLAIPITAAMKITFDRIPAMRAYGQWLAVD